MTAESTESRTGSGGGGVRTRLRRGVGRVDRWFEALRADAARRRAALAVAVVAGLALAWVHWTGLVAAGALVGLTRRTLGRALLAGVGFGLLVVAALVATTSPAAVAALAPASYVAAALGVALPAFGATARAVV